MLLNYHRNPQRTPRRRKDEEKPNPLYGHWPVTGPVRPDYGGGVRKGKRGH